MHGPGVSCGGVFTFLTFSHFLCENKERAFQRFFAARRRPRRRVRAAVQSVSVQRNPAR